MITVTVFEIHKPLRMAPFVQYLYRYVLSTVSVSQYHQISKNNEKLNYLYGPFPFRTDHTKTTKHENRSNDVVQLCSKLVNRGIERNPFSSNPLGGGNG